jgi:hypothetical protein
MLDHGTRFFSRIGLGAAVRIQYFSARTLLLRMNLAQLAKANGAVPATFDRRICGAFVILAGK